MPIRLPMIASTKAVVAFGSAALLAQVAPITGVPAVDNIAKLTFEGALVIAVGCLVRAVVVLFRINAANQQAKEDVIAKKDEQIVAMVVKVTEALVVNTVGMQANNANIQSNSQAIQDLRQAVQGLTGAVGGEVVPYRSR